jgi:hypothetical protein
MAEDVAKERFGNRARILLTAAAMWKLDKSLKSSRSEHSSTLWNWSPRSHIERTMPGICARKGLRSAAKWWMTGTRSPNVVMF